jgi:hypothetical protein
MFAVLRKACEELNARLAVYLWFQDMKEALASAFVFCGAAAQRGPWPPYFWGFLITHNDTPQSVGLLWTSDELVAEISTWQHITITTGVCFVWHKSETKGTYPRTVAGCIMFRVEKGETGAKDKIRQLQMLKFRVSEQVLSGRWGWVTGLYLGKNSDRPNLNIVWFYSVSPDRIQDSVF